MEAQCEEIERQREQFQFEIEILRERIRELEIETERSAQKQTRRSVSTVMSEEEIIQSPRENATTSSKMHSTQPKDQRSYATVAAAKPAQTPSQP